jgi:hypothetical protein
MAKNRDPHRGFLARWLHRLRWLRRLLFIGGVVGGIAKALQSRSGGGSGGGGSGGAGGGPGGSGRPAPVGGPSGPRLAASTAAPSDSDDGQTASSAPSAVRTLVSVPPLVDDDDDGTDAVVATTAVTDIVATSPTGAVDFGGGAEGDTDDADGDDGGSTAPVLTIVSDAGSDGPATGGAWVAPLEGGECPPGYLIKANDKSGIFHVPEGRSYKRTVANRCYPSAEAAEADGYRAAKA